MFRRMEFYLAAGLLGLLLGQGQAVCGQSNDPALRALLGRVVARYGSVKSYRDTGSVRLLSGNVARLEGAVSYRRVSAQDGNLVSFKTYFARPRLYRFEWTNTSPRTPRESVIWSDGRRAYGWMPNIALNDDSFMLAASADLRAFVTQAARPSSWSVFHVTSLLMKDTAYSPFADMLETMTGLSRLEDEVLDGESCHVIKGEIDGTPWVLWVGKKSLLLRKTRTVYTRGSFHEQLEKGALETTLAEETHRDIIINEPIPRDVFNYRPQLQGRDVDLTR